MLEASPPMPGLPDAQTSYNRKLIEVALPLQAINAASSREKSIRHGHPSTLHVWWARRPLAACRAVLFASLVDDPSSHPERFATPEDQERERQRLFDLIKELVQWENSLNERVLARARDEIRNSVGDDLPTIYDPFCGGGALAIEAQRLGLPTLASDLNPISVLITKALTEIPWRFKGRAPVHPSLRGPLLERRWERATGLAADVKAYGEWMLEQARDRIGSFYPPIRLKGGIEAPIIAWLWARTVHCPNPMCRAEMPLIKSFLLCAKSGKEWSIQPIVDLAAKTIRYEAQAGKPLREGTITRRGAVCIVCNEPVSLTYIRQEGKSGRISTQMMAIVADGPRGRVYLSPNDEQEHVARSAHAAWAPETELANNPRHMGPPLYGMTKLRDLFTERQLLALTTFSDLVGECRKKILADAVVAGLKDDGAGLESDGGAATAYADAVATYLAILVSRQLNYNATLCNWMTTGENILNVFALQTLSMVWDFAETNLLGQSSGSFAGGIEWIQKTVASASAAAPARVFSRDATSDWAQEPVVVLTDPPYYDNVPYADLSDFFYAWLRSMLGDIYPELFALLQAPKATELVADATRSGGDANRARVFFEDGLGRAFRAIRRAALPGYPMAVYYAFKQAAGEREGPATDANGARFSVGWEAMLGALLNSGFQIAGTWPIRSERPVRLRSMDSNALASSIILTCRPRPQGTLRCTRSDLIRELRLQLPPAVRHLRDASLAATDLEQAAIGPGMAVFSRFSEVLEPDGSTMSVRSALGLINQELAQILLGEIADVDAETRFAVTWFDGHFYDEARYGEAEVLLKAKNANLNPLRDAGVVRADRGVVQMLRPSELDGSGLLSRGARAQELPAWAQLMYLIASLTSEDGGTDLATSTLRAIAAGGAERLKDMAYHCYLACDRAKRSVEAQDFNALVTVWPDLQKRAQEHAGPTAQRLL